MTREEWAARSLDEACRRIAESGPGERHRTVYRGAAQVAPYVAASLAAVWRAWRGVYP